MQVKIKKLHSEVNLPVYKTIGAACADIQAHFKYKPLDEIMCIPNKEYTYKRVYDYYDEKEEKVCLEKLVLCPGDKMLIPTGICMEIPEGYEIVIRPRSGLAFKESLLVVTGTIDCDYRGEIFISVYNNSKRDFITINNFDRIAQVKFQKAEQCEFIEGELSDTERGNGGFGHTGK